jgi:hypothetical protein
MYICTSREDYTIVPTPLEMLLREIIAPIPYELVNEEVNRFVV